MVWADVQRIVADDSALRLRRECDCRSTAVLYQDIKGVFTRFRSLGGGFEVVSLAKCKWLAVRCSLLDKAKRGSGECKSALGHASMRCWCLRNKDRVDGRYVRREFR